jgi:hypothetical protein
MLALAPWVRFTLEPRAFHDTTAHINLTHQFGIGSSTGA